MAVVTIPRVKRSKFPGLSLRISLSLPEQLEKPSPAQQLGQAAQQHCPSGEGHPEGLER